MIGRRVQAPMKSAIQRSRFMLQTVPVAVATRRNNAGDVARATLLSIGRH